MDKIGEILKFGRTRKGWSQEQLSKFLEIDRSVLSRIETGTIQQPSYVLVKQWAKVCECEDLVGLDLTGGENGWKKLLALENKMKKIKELVSFFRVKPERR
ncbi:helix-turn-helix domain-containing protein [Paenibacillus sp. HWE-109]|uniref:helix-turn-helix transcriptional regulator n=1 Tax=Paenibacillus sp. HWE-109 TaxID=1306526 RepID=UPI001EE0EC97|nr:helix-turn-helix transcriptional regulator [Paenibacillus sp. HWE-109]UKS27172.1 helix-turn-helix domain-containing protein [Paenibacillus sp. HWE-109]